MHTRPTSEQSHRSLPQHHVYRIIGSNEGVEKGADRKIKVRECNEETFFSIHLIQSIYVPRLTSL